MQALFDSSMNSAAIAQKMLELQKAAGITSPLVNPEGSGASFITLTGIAQHVFAELCKLNSASADSCAGAGWVALAALGALITVIVAAIVFAYRRYTGLDQPYTIVTKQGDV